MKKLLTLVAMVSLLGACASASRDDDDDKMTAAPGEYSAKPGSSPVGVIPAGSLRDAQRNKVLGLAIDYPTKGTGHPLIIFSHGFGGSARGYVGISSWWASHGYVVIRPVHADSGKKPDPEKPDDAAWATQTQSDWSNRVADIRFILDSLPALEKEYPELVGKIDATRVGVSGHSYGALTALLLGGARTFAGSAATRYADPRVKAIVAMSPQGVSDERGLTRDSWAELRLPVLFMTGTADRGTTDEENMAWRKQAFDFSPAGDKWFVSIDGATNATFRGGSFDPSAIRMEPRDVPVTTRDGQGRIIQSPTSQRSAIPYGERDLFLFGRVEAISLAFWDTYLKSEPKGREFLSKLAERGGAVVELK